MRLIKHFKAWYHKSPSNKLILIRIGISLFNAILVAIGIIYIVYKLSGKW